MDNREKYDDPEEALRAAMDGQQAGMWTALPAIVTAVDGAAMTLSAQPAIQAKAQARDGTVSDLTLPLCVDVPIIWPHGGSFLLTFPLAIGDEVLLVFGSRCIDGWWQQGDVQPQLDLRMHDLSDAFAIPGPWSQKKKPAGVSASSAQLRSMDGATVIDLAAGSISINAPIVAINSDDVRINGASLKHNGKNIGSTHTHSGVLAGGGTSGPPV